LTRTGASALLQARLEAGRVVGEHDRVDVEAERHEASPSSWMRSIGSSRRVRPTLTIRCPNAPTVLITYTGPARIGWLGAG
jgi:hypothetical protein